jgi:WD40 repeat protein
MINFQKKLLIKIVNLGIIFVLSLGLLFFHISVAFAQTESLNSKFPQDLQLIKVFDRILPYTAFAFSPDSNTLATGSEIGEIKIWNANDGTLIFNFPHNYFFGLLGPHSDQITALAFSPDGKTLVSGSMDNTVKVWNLNNTELLHDISGFSDGVDSLVFRSNSQAFISQSEDIKIWEVDTGNLIRTIPELKADASSISISSDGEIFFNLEHNSLIKIRDINTGEVLKTFNPTKKTSPVSISKYSHFNEEVEDIERFVYSPKIQSIATIGRYKGLKYRWLNIFNLVKGEWLGRLSGSRYTISLAFNADGTTLASSGYYAYTDLDKIISNEILVWDLKTSEVTFRHAFSENSSSVTALFFSPNGKKLVSVNEDHTAILWNLPDK